MARVREKQLQKRKQETLDAVIRRLTEGGYNNLNMDELADEVGVSKPTLYQDFNSKDELIAQALVRMFEHLREHLNEDPSLSPLEQLERIMRLMLTSRSKQRNLMSMVDVEAVRNILQHHLHPVEHLTAIRDRLINVVQRAQAQGEIDPDLPPWVVVGLLFSLQGIIMRPGMKEDPPRSDDEIAEAIESVIHIFMRGIRVPVNNSPPTT